MAQITAASVKALRDRTGAGMMDCKRALGESGGDGEAALDWLRKKGLAAAAKRAGRVAAEGLVGRAVRDKAGALVEVNCETDFAARNEVFQKAVGAIADLALRCGGELEALKGAPFPDERRSVEEQIAYLAATIGENVGLRRAALIEASEGVVASYIHGALAPGVGRIGVLVALESSGDAQKLDAFGHLLAMHIAATAPLALTVDDLDPAAVERERAIFAEQARASGKPDEIVRKMVEGRLKKFYQEAVLLEQVYVIDGKTKISKLLEGWAGELGSELGIARFVRFALGEGLKDRA